MKTIVLCNQKGGVGKSTTAATLAAGLYMRGKRILMIDTDPQSNLSFMYGVNLLELPHTLYNVFRGECTLQDAIQPVKIGMDIITGGLELTAADSEFTSRLGRERMLSEALEPVQTVYDFCIIDTNPSLGVLTMTALTAADYAIIPMQADALSLQGAAQLRGFISNVQKYCNPALKVAGILLTMYNPRAVLSRGLEDAIKQAAADMGSIVFDTRIRRTQEVSNAIALQKDIFSNAPESTATLDYEAWIDELLTTYSELDA